MKTHFTTPLVLAVLAATLTTPATAFQAPMGSETVLGTTAMFKGVEANQGTATIFKRDGKFRIRVSSDFRIPPSPAPHWQVVDGSGNTYLLDRFTIVGDKTKREIVLPSYIKSVKKVQVWCSFAEVLLGEGLLERTINLR